MSWLTTQDLHVIIIVLSIVCFIGIAAYVLRENTRQVLKTETELRQKAEARIKELEAKLEGREE